jgi:hypothetical protein
MMRKRQIKVDDFANRCFVNEVLNALEQKVFPAGITKIKRKSFLYAIHNTITYQSTDTKKGRKSKFPREQIIFGGSVLQNILDDKTNSQITVRRFVSKYLSILHFPADLVRWLESKEISLEEAHLLYRIKNPHVRERIKKQHLVLQSSQKMLRIIIEKEITGQAKIEFNKIEKIMTWESLLADDLLILNPNNSTHLLWEQVKLIVFELQELDLEFLAEDEVNQMLKTSGELLHQIQKFKKFFDSSENLVD